MSGRSGKARVGKYARIVPAKSTSACAAATSITGGLRCEMFDAVVMEWHPVSGSSTEEDLLETNETVKVRHKFQEGMVSGEYITIGQLCDGRWELIVWPCPS